MGECGIRIGTSGWHYKHWLGPFYPTDLRADHMLSVYVEHFDTVEINNSFYHLPLETTFTEWRNRTPPGFCFAVKGSRFLTHIKKLKDPAPGLEKFLPRAELLKDKLGPILFQLRPRWHCDPERLEGFLEALPKSHRYTFEFRDRTWHVPAIYKILERHNAAFCIYHAADFVSPLEITTDFVYVRMHGPGEKYQGSYCGEDLKVWASRIADWRHRLKAIYLYFNNDPGGHAVTNALALKKLVGA